MQDTILTEKLKKLGGALGESMMEQDPDLALRRLISWYGTNTACDRAFLAEFREDGTFDLTTEWCGLGIEPLIRRGRGLSGDFIGNAGMEQLRAGKTLRLADVRLQAEGTAFSGAGRGSSMILAPVRIGGRLAGFAGVENPPLEEEEQIRLMLPIVAAFAGGLLLSRDHVERLHFLEERDALTGLYNRNTFQKKVKEILRREAEKSCGGKARKSCIVYLNASNFKDFNAFYGVEEGDRCLVHIADLIRSAFETDIACRSYSDHFFVFFRGEDVEERIRALHEKCLTMRRHFRVWLQAGICETDVTRDTGTDCDAAKTACDQLPDDNISYLNVYSPALVKSLYEEKYIQDNADCAVKHGHILVWFQPVVRTRTGKLCSFEALARWDDPTLGFLSPGIFIPVLEKHHRCYKIDNFVVEECCRLLRERLDRGLPCVPVSFNISRTDFMIQDPVKIVTDLAAKYGIDHRYLCVEITESSVMEDPERIRRAILAFKQQGFQVWMDDFGSAYSSLNTLKDFEFDEIKLDMAFMRNLNENAKIIVRSAVQMAEDLGIHTLCEGVETKEQLEFLRQVGCEKIQGYYYGKPMPLEDQIRSLREKGILPETREEAERMEREWPGGAQPLTPEKPV